jgi:hypothetical protein
MRSIMQWWAKKIGSYAAVVTSPMSPPTQPCTSSWKFSSRSENEGQSGSSITPPPVRGFETSRGRGRSDAGLA